MVKSELRSSLVSERNAIPSAERSDLSAEIRSVIRSIPEYAAAECLLIYYPIGSEPELLQLADEAIKEGKTVAFPRVGDEGLVFIRVMDTASLRPGFRGIPEPDEEAGERVDEFAGSICIVPALAVDVHGNRLGYGGGYYDRFLRGYTGFSICGVFPQLFREELPAEPHDVHVNAAAVPGFGVLRFE